MSDVTVLKEFYLKKIKELETENRRLRDENKRFRNALEKIVSLGGWGKPLDPLRIAKQALEGD